MDWRGIGWPQVAMHSQLPRFLVVHCVMAICDLSVCLINDYNTIHSSLVSFRKKETSRYQSISSGRTMMDRCMVPFGPPSEE